MAAQAYCVKCRKKVDIQNPTRITMKNGRPALHGATAAISAFRYLQEIS